MDDKTTKAAASEKAKALAAALSQIEKQFGKGSIMRYGDNDVRMTSRWFPRVRSVWTSRWVSAACREAAWLKSTVRNPRARPR